MQLFSFIQVTTLCVAVTYFFSGVVGFRCFISKAKVLPNKRVFTRGEDITVTCMIDTNCYNGPVNASSLGFKINDTVYPPKHPYVSYVNETTTKLTVPDSDFNSGGIYQCVQFENGVYMTGSTFGFVLNQVKVGIPPPKVNNNSFDCLVYNWVSMNCSFDPGQSTNLKTTYNWSYTVHQNFYNCPNYDSMSRTCKWSKQDKTGFMETKFYVMKVKAENSLGVSESLYANIDPSVLVKPAPVKDIKVQPIGSTSVMITFDVVAYNKPQIFRIFYKSQFDDTWKYKETDHLMFNSTLSKTEWVANVEKTKNVTINGLIPFAKYSLKISAIPSIFGKATGSWSEDATAIFQQPSDAPWAAPAFAPGSFQRSDCKNNCRTFCGDNCAEVTIFWPKIEERFRNGNIAAYEIEVGETIEDQSSGISVSKKVYLYNNRSYTISFRAATQKGLFSQNRSRIYIPKQTEAPAAPAYVAAIALNSSAVLMKWQQTEGNDQQLPTTYTVFWCIGKVQCIYKSDSDLYSEIVPADERKIVLNINTTERYSVNEYWFSVSANNDLEHSSGMISSECVYKRDNDLSPPELKKSLFKEDNSIAVDWSAIECEDKNDSIIYYEIWFCEVHPDNKDICQTGTQKHEMANGNETQHIISKDIKADSQYLVWAVSVTDSGKSRESKKVKVVTSGYTPGEITGVVVGVLIGAVLVGFGIFFIVRKWGTEICQFYTNKYPIVIPGEGNEDDKDITLGQNTLSDDQYYSSLPDASGVQRKNENEKNQQKLKNQKKSQHDDLADSGKGDSASLDYAKVRISDPTETASEDYAKFGVNDKLNSNNSDCTMSNKNQHVTIEMTMISNKMVDSTADTGYKRARLRTDPNNADKEVEQELLDPVSDNENDDSGSQDMYDFPGEKDNFSKNCKLKESDNIAERNGTNIDSSDISSSGSIPYKGFILKNTVYDDNVITENDTSDSSMLYKTAILNSNRNNNSNYSEET